MVGPELLCPEDLARRFLQTLKAAGHARCEQAGPDNQRRRVGPVSHLTGGVALKRHRADLFPEGDAGLGVRGHHDFLAPLAVHRVEHAVLDDRRGVALAERALPDHPGAARRPRVFQTAGLGLKVAVGPAPLRPRDAFRTARRGWFRRDWFRSLGESWCRQSDGQERASIHDEVLSAEKRMDWSGRSGPQRVTNAMPAVVFFDSSDDCGSPDRGLVLIVRYRDDASPRRTDIGSDAHLQFERSSSSRPVCQCA